MSNFKAFATAINQHLQTMYSGTLCRVYIDPTELWEEYLASFPEGTNPIFRVRTEHDGSYDRNFVKKMGNVVQIVGDTQKFDIVTIWDAKDLEYPYNVVCERLSEIVRSRPIVDGFRINNKETKIGYIETTEKLEDGGFITWNHFNTVVPPRLSAARRARSNVIGRKVKQRDVRDNLNVSRLKKIGKEDIIRLEEYRQVERILLDD